MSAGTTVHLRILVCIIYQLLNPLHPVKYWYYSIVDKNWRVRKLKDNFGIKNQTIRVRCEFELGIWNSWREKNRQDS
jgi:hypothetical protein